jgi:hypothetical protein
MYGARHPRFAPARHLRFVGERRVVLWDGTDSISGFVLGFLCLSGVRRDEGARVQKR